MRILVTGATGHIGRHVCEHLAGAGHQVNALTRPGSDLTQLRARGIRCFPGDTTVPQSVAAALESCEAVIHAAGVKSAGRSSTFERVNVRGAGVLLELAQRANVDHLIFISSLAAQGPSAHGMPHRIPEKECPIGAYGRSQLAAEQVIQESPLAPRATILRPAIVYGPHDPDMLQWARIAQKRVLPVRPNFDLSFLHVDDLARLVCELVDSGPQGIGPYFLSDGVPQTMEGVFDQLERILGAGPSLRVYLGDRVMGPVAGSLQRLTQASGLLSGLSQLVMDLNATGWACDSDQAKAALGFNPSVDFLTGFPETLRWYKNQGLV